MPEGPEVKRMIQDLSHILTDRRLVGFEILSGRYTKAPIEGSSEIVRELPSLVIEACCHGKFSYIKLEKDWSIWITLGMTGWWSSHENKHSRVRFDLDNSTNLYFNDQRNFGTLKFSKGLDSLRKKLSSLGPDLLAHDLAEKEFVSLMRKRNNLNVCKAIMDQSVLAGVGNYVKAEALWLSKIDPQKSISGLTDESLNILKESIRNIMLHSYENDGATFKTHKNFDGKTGKFSQHFMCYGRKLDADGNQVVRLETPDGRTTHWSPTRQTN